MKYTLSIFSFLIIFVSLVESQTIVPGSTINGSTWTLENEPYIITGNMTIVNLTIEPGVHVQFRNNFNFDVDGILQAQGFYSDSIYFQSEPGNSAGWKGFKFKSGTTNTSLSYCRIENANTQGIRIEGGASPLIFNSRISDNIGNGIFIKDSETQLRNCIIKYNSENGVLLDVGKFTATNIIIASNKSAGIMTSDDKDDITLINTVIANNQTSGIDCQKGGLTIGNSIIYQNTEGIIKKDQVFNVTYSDVQGSSTYPGTGNIRLSPLFEAGSAYTLTDSSPCIDAGNPDAAYEDKYFPPSKGAARNDMGAYGGPSAFGWSPPLLITPQIVEYGRTTQDSTKTVILHIDNYRESGITVSDIEFEGTHPDVFSSAEDYFYLPLLQDKSLQISFTPDNVDIFSANLAFSTVGHGNIYIPISGEGVLPRIEVLQSALNFGLVLPGDSLRLTLPIRNLGGDTLRVNLSLTSDSTFHIDKEYLKINPDTGRDSVRVTFKPPQPQSYQNYLIISSNDRSNPNIAVVLTGEGLGPIILPATETLNFGTVPVSADSTLDLLISNNGNAALLIDSLRLSSASAAFEIVADDPLTIEAGENAVIAVRFHPPEWGENTGILYIYSNDRARPLLPIALNGTGLAAELVLSDDVLDFGPVFLTKDTTLILTVSNPGNLPLRLDSIYTESKDSAFKLPVTIPDQIEPEQSIDITLTFMPADTGKVTDNLILRSNDPLKDQDTISLIGFGARPVLDPVDMALDFGTVHLPADTTLYVNVKNSGNYALVIKSFTIVSEGGGFSRVDSLVFPDTLIQQVSRNYPVIFKPFYWGADSGQITIETNDPLKPQTAISLRGTGLAPQISVTPSLIEFGAIRIGSDTTFSFTIDNLGNSTLVIDSLVSYPESNVFIINGPTPAEIEAGKSDSVSVRFQPVQLDSALAQIFIYSTDPAQPEKRINLSGKGIAPIIALSLNQVDFGSRPFNSDSVINFYIYNKGDVLLHILQDSITIRGDTASAFSLSYLEKELIFPHDSALIAVQLHADTLGLKQAELHIISNDPFTPLKKMLLTGIVFDNQPCSIAFDSLNSTHPLTNGMSANLRFIISSPSTAIDSAYILLRHGGKSTYQNLPLTKQGITDTWSVLLDSTHVSTRGIEFFIRAFHGLRTTLFPEEGSAQPASIGVFIPEIVFPKQTKKEIYQMISIPFETGNQHLDDLFSDNLGSYDKNLYRVFDCINGVDYTEINDMDIPLAPGKALWLITRVPTKLDIRNGQTVPTNQKFTRELKKGWNMIATPYDFAVDWEEISEILKLRYFVDGEWTYAQVLEPFNGYAVYTGSDTSLIIPAKEKIMAKLPKKINPAPLESGWEFQLQAQAGAWKDRFNYAGVHPLASAAIDRYDDPEPPPIGNFISLGLSIGDDGKRFSTDYREAGKDGYTFVIEMSSNVNEEKIIRLTPHTLPEQYDWTVICKESKVNIGKDEIKTDLNAATYLLIVGTKDYLGDATAGFADMPLVYQLRQNYPNPFNPFTTIKFQLPETQKVTATIFNILGQKVKTLLEQTEKQSGYHQIEWDGSNQSGQKVSSGIYFLRFKSEQFERTIKMVLQR